MAKSRELVSFFEEMLSRQEYLIPMVAASFQYPIHSGNRTEFQYRMAWARTKAKSDGKITSSKRETWQVN